jgi:TrmH family RNA methyltransferase
VIIEQEELRKISALSTPQHVLALADIPGEEADINYAGGLKLVLDNIKDPGNMGTLIRTADWFGINEVICSEECVDCYNPKVVQGAMGSLFRLKLFSRNLKELFDLNESKNSLPVYGTVLNGRNIYEEELSKNGFILIGNESVGIEEEHISFITNALTIPASPLTKADSLNAAIAAGIVCSEFFRRK